MKDLNFVLTKGDLEVIGDALQNTDKHQDLIMMFSILEMQEADVKIVVGNDITYVPFNSLDETEKDGEEIVMRKFQESILGPSQPCNLSEVVVEEPVAPEPKTLELVKKPEPVKVIADWDDRVPKPVFDPEMVEAAQKRSGIPEPTPNTTFDPLRENREEEAAREARVTPSPMDTTPAPPRPRNVRPTPPKPVKTEPSYDNGDEMCDDCGGFAQTNPHSDPNMNCGCHELGDPTPPQPTPQPTQAWSTGEAPTPQTQPASGGWTTT